MAELEVYLRNVNEFPSNDILDFLKCQNFETDSPWPAYKCNIFLPSAAKKYDLNEIQPQNLSEYADKAAENLWDTITPIIYMDNSLKNLKKLYSSYKQVMEEFSVKLNKWSELRLKNIEQLQHLSKMFRLIIRSTTTVSFISSTLDVVIGVGTFMNRFFNVHRIPRYPLIAVSVIGGVSVIGSLLALNYSKRTVEDILRDIREEKHLVRCLEIIYRRGHWIDKDVEDLFPHGIDSDLVKGVGLDSEGIYMDEKAWKRNISSAIILTNIKKDKALITNQKFLATVKEFVESPVARMWFNRMKLRKLLDGMMSRLDSLPDQKSITGNEIFLNRAAVNLYPVLFPMFVNSGNGEKMRFICSFMASVTYFINFVNSDDEDFENIKSITLALKKDYKYVKSVTGDLENEYD